MKKGNPIEVEKEGICRVLRLLGYLCGNCSKAQKEGLDMDGK